MTQLINLKVDIPEKNAYSYDILIGENLLAQADKLVKKYSKANKFLIVTNETVAGLYRDSLKIDNAFWLVLKDGEEYKNFDNLKLILDAAVEHRLERKDCIIAFGGGVIGDMAGCCELYERLRFYPDTHNSSCAGGLFCRRKGCD